MQLLIGHGQVPTIMPEASNIFSHSIDSCFFVGFFHGSCTAGYVRASLGKIND